MGDWLSLEHCHWCVQSTVVGHSNADIMMPVVCGSFSQVYSSCKVLGTAREQTVTIVEAGQWQR